MGMGICGIEWNGSKRAQDETGPPLRRSNAQGWATRESAYRLCSPLH